VIGSASRAGTVLCTVELLAMLGFGLVRLRDPKTGQPTRSTTTVLVMIPLLAAIFTLAVGWERVWLRFQQNDPYLVRQEFVVAAVDMAKQRPLTGYGLGTFPEVYQRYAIKDFPFYANHTHNDWAEFAADGGVPFLLLVLIPFVVAFPTAVRHPWGLGLIAILLHACVDYPFPRPAVSGWMFVLLGLLYMARTSDRDSQRTMNPPISENASAQEPV
jgi:O-antigen ligase